VNPIADSDKAKTRIATGFWKNGMDSKVRKLGMGMGAQALIRLSRLEF
jgi:hypothetical protein